ncbi:MAG: AmmeMemoRadiSam system protein A [Phycisphaerales bacterium]|nr:AmmeMemoRadiSam system protein A [Phycisphaerales bacterium]
MTEHEKLDLLRLARRTAGRALQGSPGPAEREDYPKIPGRFGGAFVTFYNGIRLRGCVGTFAPTQDIAETVEQVTIASLVDPRFEDDRITADELVRLDIEVSVLSDLVPADDPLALIVGVQGVKVVMGRRAGCFLPKVAVERGWSAEEFLSFCCAMKAGLPPDAWRNPECQVFLFTADAFRESVLLAGQSSNTASRSD